MSKTLSTLSEFNRIKSSGDVVVVDFFATWCGPCRVIAPTYEKLAGQYKQAQFFKCDVDQNQDIAKDQGVSAMPTFIVYKGGEVKETIKGANPRALENAIRSHAGPPSDGKSPTHNWGAGRTLGSDNEPSRDVAADPMESVRGAVNSATTAFQNVDVSIKIVLGLLSLYFVYVFVS